VQSDTGATVSGFIEASEFEFREVIALRQSFSTAICSGTLYHKQEEQWLTLGTEFTWRVDQTEDGLNFISGEKDAKTHLYSIKLRVSWALAISNVFLQPAP